MAELLDELLLRCRRGESSAVTELVRRFWPWATDFAAALLGDAHLAEDAAQSAFVTALARLSDLREARAFAGWFRQIVRTEANRIGRARGRASNVDDIDLPSSAATSAACVEASEEAQMVRRALRALPPRGREAAELFYFDELSTRQIAERLAIPRGTVKRRLHDARLKLKENLRRVVDPPPPL